jgi:branched-subunit amino acid transport protein
MMRRTAFYTIYAICGLIAWFIFGNLILLASISSFWQFLQNLPFSQQVAYAVCFVPLGVITALIQAALMAKGGRELSKWLMGGAPLVLGAIVGVVLAMAGPPIITQLLGPIEETNNAIARFIVGLILGVISICLTTALAALMRHRLGVRGALPRSRI